MATVEAIPDTARAMAAPTVAECADGAAWDGYVDRAPGASGYHLWRWRELFSGVFGHTPIYLAASRGGAIVGVLPLVRFDSRIFGRALVSLPFLNYGGVVADDREAAEALVGAAGALRTRLHARHVELRHRARQFEALAPRHHKVTMLLPLPGSPDALWSALDRKVRNQVRKAEKHALTVSVGGVAEVGAFYGVFAENMRDLGTPVYGRHVFAAIATLFPERTRLFVVRHEGRPVAASFTWRWRDTVEVPWASSLRAASAMAPNMLLYWAMLKDAVESGAAVFDFGRSTPDEGTFHFKKQWGAAADPLCWEYDLGGGALPDHGPRNPKFQLAIAAWRKLPLAVANRLGPLVASHLP
jgi:FemAB-related protein (PEP-CTERM system-associated)